MYWFFGVSIPTPWNVIWAGMAKPQDRQSVCTWRFSMKDRMFTLIKKLDFVFGTRVASCGEALSRRDNV